MLKNVQKEDKESPVTGVLKYIELNTSELRHWDEYVQQHPMHTPYHLSGWGLAVMKSYKQGFRFIVAKQDDRIVGVLPICEFISLGRKKDLCSLPYCDLGGVLADSQYIQDGLEEYVESIQASEGYRSIEIRERFSYDIEPIELEGKKVSMLLPLPETAAELLSSFKSKLRSQIRKAEKNGLTTDLGKSSYHIDEFYSVLAENLHRLGSPIHSKRWFIELIRELNDSAVISLVKKGETVVGAGMIIFTGDKVAIPWASTRVQFNNLSPNMLLYWSLLEFSCNSGAKEFDFGRSTFNEGTYKFKKQWGCQPRLLNWRVLIDGNENANQQGSNSRIRSFIERTWRNLPLPIANFIGPKVRRFISL